MIHMARLPRSTTLYTPGKWTSGDHAALFVETPQGTWKAMAHKDDSTWSVRGPDPDDPRHYADGEVFTADPDVKRGGAEGRYAAAKKRARAYIQEQLRSRGTQHAARASADPLRDVVFETERYWVKRVPKGFEVYEAGLTHSKRVAVIGYPGDKGLQRAKLEIERREAATTPSQWRHSTKKSPAQLDREIAEALAGTGAKPISESSYLGGLRYKTEVYGPGGNRPVPEVTTTTSQPPKKPRKSKAQRARDAAEALEKNQRWLVMFQMPGSQWAYVARTGSGSTMDPDAAFDFGSRGAAESHAASMQGPRSSLRAKVTSRRKA